MGAAAPDGWIPRWCLDRRGRGLWYVADPGGDLDWGMAGNGDANGQEACRATRRRNISLLGLPGCHRPNFDLNDVSVSALRMTRARALPSVRCFSR